MDELQPHVAPGRGLGRSNTTIYYSGKDLTLGVLLRALLVGDQAVGEVGFRDSKAEVDPSVKAIDASRSLGGYYISAHTDYAHKFHYFARPDSPAIEKGSQQP